MYSLNLARRRKALPTTEMELELIASAAMTGDSRMPVNGYKTRPRSVYRTQTRLPIQSATHRHETAAVNSLSEMTGARPLSALYLEPAPCNICCDHPVRIQQVAGWCALSSAPCATLQMCFTAILQRLLTSVRAHGDTMAATFRMSPLLMQMCSTIDNLFVVFIGPIGQMLIDEAREKWLASGNKFHASDLEAYVALLAQQIDNSARRAEFVARARHDVDFAHFHPPAGQNRVSGIGHR